MVLLLLLRNICGTSRLLLKLIGVRHGFLSLMTSPTVVAHCSLGLLAMSYHLMIMMVIVLLGLANEG